jgi:hypothetical protein
MDPICFLLPTHDYPPVLSLDGIIQSSDPTFSAFQIICLSNQHLCPASGAEGVRNGSHYYDTT